MITFEGTHQQIGRDYGTMFPERIQANLDSQVRKVGYQPLPFDNPEFVEWVKEQERLIEANWPWMLEEMHGVAKGSGAEYDEILLLNLRPWQWDYYGKDAEHHCSSLVIRLLDGTVANAGALDDVRHLYCGPVKFVPEDGYRFVTWPITGTSWCTRVFNSAGLAVGISSQLLPGLKRKPGAVNQDLATRAIAQTCATVDDVRRFCEQHPFGQNLVCSDSNGDVFCAHQTTAGTFKLADCAPFCVTNHVVCDDIACRLSRLGVTEFPTGGKTHDRRNNLIGFCERDGNVSAEEVREFVSRRDDSDPGTITNVGTIAVTYANPQAEPGVFWTADPNAAREWERVVV